MKNKFLVLCFLTVGILFINACSKDDENNNNNTSSCTDGIQNGNETGVDCGGSCSPCSNTVSKIKSRSQPDFTYGEFTVNYTYDEQGRVITVVPSAPGFAISHYTYSNDTVFHTSTNGITETYLLNSEGYAAASINVGGTSETATHTYDNDGHLISTISSGSSATYTWSEGNLISAVTPGGTTTFTYFTDTVNTIGNANYGLMFLGKDSKDLIKTSTTAGITEVYSYEFDSLNRVTKMNGFHTYTYF